jgi:WD40 repeat protein
LKTSRYVKDVLEDEVVETIWVSGPDEDYFQALVLTTQDEPSILKVQVPTGKVLKRTKLPPHIKVPDHVHQVHVDQNEQNETIDRIYFVTMVGSVCQIISEKFQSKKHLMFGQVSLDCQNQPLMAFNGTVFAKISKSVSGQSGIKMTVILADGSSTWTKKVEKNRPITALACPKNGDKIVATGDKSGRVRVWRDENVFSEGHWHSLPVKALHFSPDGVHLLTGGGEGAVVKWESKTMRRLAIVPRIGTSVHRIRTSFGKVVASTGSNSLKVFTANLEDDQLIVGLGTRSPKKMVWHASTGCLVLIGTNQQIQFFDPLERCQKFALEAIGQNIILGERDQKVATSHLTSFDMSQSGTWLVTVEKNWDQGNVLRLWTFKDNQFNLNTRINEAHSSDEVTFVQFVPMMKNLGLLTCGLDKSAKLWQLDEETERWQPVKTFNYLGLNPTCGTCSPDGTVLVIAFGPILVLYDTKTLEILTTLALEDIRDPYTSLAFGLGPKSSLLIGANKMGLFMWNLLNNTLQAKLTAEDASIFTSSKKHLILKSQKGIFALDQTMKSSLVSQLSHDHMGLVLDSYHDRLYFVDTSKKSQSVLKFLSLRPKQQKIPSRKGSPPEDSLHSSGLDAFSKLSVKVNEDIYYARMGPAITGDIIKQKVSNCSESIIKKVLPI